MEQLRRDLETGFAGRLDELTGHASNDLFRRRIGRSASQAAWWDAETRGNWLWGYTLMAHLSESRTHCERSAHMMSELAGTQDSDGYIGIYERGTRYSHEGGDDGELWAQSRVLLALLAFHELTGDGAHLDATLRSARLTMERHPGGRGCFRPPSSLRRSALTGLTHGLCFADVAERLFAITGDLEFRDFGLGLYDRFCELPPPFQNDDMALANLLDTERPFSGHAVHTAEHLRALLWAAAVSGRDDLGRAVECAVGKLGHHRLPSGALAGDEGVHGLPTPDAGYEYCTTTELLLSLFSALEKTGNPRFGDWAEILAFNAGQGARMPDGRAVAYLSADTRFAACASRPDGYSFGRAGKRFKFSPTHDDVACCCNPNAVRFLPHYIGGMWMRLGEGPGLVAAAYGPCRLDTAVGGVPVTVEERTFYPFSDTITLLVTPDRPVRFVMLLRKPEWAYSATVAAPQDTQIQETKGWFRLDVEWKSGDMVELRLPAPVGAVPYPTGEYAFRRGPLQFVQPIPHRMCPTRTYPVPGFYDYDIVPADMGQVGRVPVPDACLDNLGMSLERDPVADLDRPWDRPPLALRLGTDALVPMGCAVLRRSAFPVRGLPPWADSPDESRRGATTRKYSA